MSFARYQEIRAEINDRLQELKNIGQDAFNEEAKAVFEKNPNLKSFSWTQYTPYFNDGETCNFNVYADYPEFVMDSQDGEEEIQEFCTPYRCEKDENGREIRPADHHYSPEVWEAGLDILTFLKNFDDDDMKLFFGDHAKITVCKDSIDIEQYDHD